MRRPVAALLASVVVAAGTVVTVATPSQAATPRCNDVRSVYYNHDRFRRVAYPAYTSAAAPSTYRCLLTEGTLNSDPVAVLQRGLNTCYGERLATDGDFGSLTRQALQRAQRVMGVLPDGAYGPQTATAMKYPVRTTAGDFVVCSTFKL